jgi:hypothetical protein
VWAILRGIEPLFISRRAHSLVTTVTELHSLFVRSEVLTVREYCLLGCDARCMRLAGSLVDSEDGGSMFLRKR